MKSNRPVGIAGYGAYVPRYRVLTESISSIWRPRDAAPPAVAEKSVPGPDEDVVTMAIEASRTALARAAIDPARVGAVWVGSESKPYAVKPSATVVAEAVGVTPAVLAADMEFACKAGSEAMQAGVALVGSGMADAALAIGMDTSQSKPGDALEYTAGSGGAAFLFAPAEEAVAVVEGSVSHVTDTPDFFRREGAPYPEHGGRFTGEPSYFEHTLAASRKLLSDLDAEPGDFSHAVFHQPVPKFVRRVASQLGFARQQIDTGLVAPRMGNAYSGSSLLGLAAILDVAEAGNRIFFCSYGSGAGSDAFAFQVTDQIGSRRAGPKVTDYLARRREISDYGHYLRLQEEDPPIMRDIFIVGIGQTPVGEHWDLGLRDLGAAAIEAALADAGIEKVGGLYVGNMLSGTVNGQENLATLVADASGLLPVEAMKVEAACASGGACVRAATLAVASGAHDVAVAVGLEKMTDGLPGTVSAGLATASDQDFEASHGFSFVTLSALMMRRYLHEHGVDREAFAPFVINAHRNAAGNPNAMFRGPISAEEFRRSPLVSSPISVLDASPVCDGAAAVVVCSRERLRPQHEPVRIVASAVATDTIALGARRDVISLESARKSAERCFKNAGMKPEQMDLFEAHDAFSIITALSLEACGFAARGEALSLAESDEISLAGGIPLSTAGGLKARGHPVGASGSYQIVEASLQLRGQAGDNQLASARRALTQSIGGHGSVAVTHILEA